MAPVSPLTDPELLSLLKDNDHGAFTEIYNRYWKTLYGSALKIIQDKDIAQDITQNIFISLWHRRTEAEIISLKPYLQQATRFAVFAAIRQMKTDQSFYSRLAEVTADIITDNPLLFKEQQAILKELVETLPTDCRETFRLSREESMTYKQIAALLGISEKTVEKRMSKSLRHIRQGLSFGVYIAVICLKQ